MKNILDKIKLNKIYESYKLTENQAVYIHHPITEDIVKVLVKKVNRNNFVATVEESSPYYGQPDLIIDKTKIVGLA